MERRLKFGAVVLALALASGCKHRDEQAAERTCRLIEADLRHDHLPQALERAKTSAVSWGNQPASERYIEFRLLEAEALLEKNKADEALGLLNELRPVTRKLIVRQKVDRANALIKLGQLGDAEITVRQALDGAQPAGLGELGTEAMNLNGQLLWKKGDSKGADEAYRTALESADARGDSYWRARILNNLGYTRLQQEHCDDAIPYFEKALAAIEPLDAPRLKSVFLSNLAICHNELGDIDRSLNLRMQALAMQERMDASLSRANSYGEIGRIYEEQHNPRKAVEYYERALKLARDFHSTTAATWAVNLASAQVELQDWSSAERWNDLARRLDPSGAEDLNLWTNLNTAAIRAGQGKAAEAKKYYEEVATSRSSNAWPKWAAWDELGKLNAATGDGAEANRCFDNAITLITNTRALLSRDQDKIPFLSQPIRIYQDYVEALVRENQPQKAMLLADSSRAQVMFEELSTTDRTAIGVRELTAAAVSANAVFLSYWFAPERSFAWVVTREGAQMAVLPESEATIRQLVGSYREEMQGRRDPLSNAGSAGWKLSAALIAPVQRWIPAGANVIVVPDGPLHDLNLETLPVPAEQPHYWIEQAVVSIAPSLAGLASAGLAEKPVKNERGLSRMLIVGDAEPVAKYSKLGYAGEEIAALRKRFPASPKTVLTGSEATPARYREEKPEQFSLIHFAAHAEANPDTPLDSAVILSPSRDEYKLYARDVVDAKVPLRAALVTISGCTSAGAKSYHGEGLVGFAWAFLHAGAQNVIAGLWSADDKFTTRLMDRMYAKMETGEKPANSLRGAKLELMHGRFGPYYWGPFQIYRRSAR